MHDRLAVGPGVSKHGSVTRMLDLCDLTRRHGDRESLVPSSHSSCRLWPGLAWPGVMSCLVLSYSGPAFEIDQASQPSLSSHHPPNPRSVYPTTHEPNATHLILYPLSLSPRDSREQPFNPFFDTAILLLHHYTPPRTNSPLQRLHLSPPIHLDDCNTKLQ
jgi:hypothetical protein